MENKSICKAAFSQIDITPDYQVPLIGYYREEKSKGVLHPLCSQVLLFRNDKSYFCIITIDSLGLSRRDADTLRIKVSNALDVGTEKVMLCSSHTHSAPDPDALAPNGKKYFEELCDKVLQNVEHAKTGLVPCKVSWSVTDTEIGENRREGCNVVDRRLGALKVINSDTEKPIAVLLRLTAHANILMRCNNMVSSDFFGAAREKLKAVFACPVLLVQGPAGNIKATGVNSIHGGEISDLNRIADSLAGAAKKLCFDMQSVNDIQMVSKETIFHARVPDEREAEKIASDGLKECYIDGTGWLAECERLRKDNIKVQSQKIELQLFKINDGCICGVADEIFCEIALEVQDKTRNPLLFLNGYTNGCSGYLPTKEELRKGGFEPFYSYLIFYWAHERVMPFDEDTADKLVDFTVETWNSISQKAPG